MKTEIPITTVIKSRINGITIEVCHGEIPDKFRQLKFGTLKELELPDRKVTDKEFTVWIAAFRKAEPNVASFLLEDTQCS